MWFCRLSCVADRDHFEESLRESTVAAVLVQTNQVSKIGFLKFKPGFSIH